MSELYRAKWYATQAEMIADLDRHIAEQDHIITAYQIAKDNLELRLLNAQQEWLGVNLDYCPRPAQVY